MWGNSVSLPSFLLGAASGALIAYLCSRNKQANPGEWHLPRFHQSHSIPSKEQVLYKFHTELSKDVYEEVKECWKQLSLAKHRRDLTHLVNYLTEDCVYEDCASGAIWKGHEGANEYHQRLFAAFPDVEFETLDLIIGPQGVCNEVLISGTHTGSWNDHKPSGKVVRFRILVLMPWDDEKKQFRGERIYTEAWPAD